MSKKTVNLYDTGEFKDKLIGVEYPREGFCLWDETVRLIAVLQMHGEVQEACDNMMPPI